MVYTADKALLAANWKRTVPPGTDPTSGLARADITGSGMVYTAAKAQIAAHWKQTWTNTPPPG
jgi:hypothetical protein